jgi:FkbM family methyltransferase
MILVGHSYIEDASFCHSMKMVKLVRSICAWLANGPTKPLVQKGCQWLLSKPRRILSGPARGLLFDPRNGGYPGQILGTTDHEEQAAFASLLKSGDVLYDVGANVGFYAIMGAKIVGEGGRVYAFEPQPHALATLRNNILLNRFNCIDVVPAIVTAQSGSLSVLVTTESQQSRVLGDDEEGGERMEAISLDEWSKSAPRPPSMVMIDVEGHEHEVLMGMRTLIHKFTPKLLVEVHPGAEELVRAFFDTHLKPLGYTPQRLDGRPFLDGFGRFHVTFVKS